jgi:hypothetical protein
MPVGYVSCRCQLPKSQDSLQYRVVASVSKKHKLIFGFVGFSLRQNNFHLNIDLIKLNINCINNKRKRNAEEPRATITKYNVSSPLDFHLSLVLQVLSTGDPPKIRA